MFVLETWSSNQMILSTNHEEGGRQEDLQPYRSLPKIQSYENRSLQVTINGSKCNFGQNLKMEKVRRIQIDAILSPFTFLARPKKGITVGSSLGA